MRSSERGIMFGLAAAGMLLFGSTLARPVFAQEIDPEASSDEQAITQDVNSDDLIESQLQTAVAGDKLTLVDVPVRDLVRLPWIGGEFDLAFIAKPGKILGFGIQSNCVYKLLAARKALNPSWVPGIYHVEDARISAMEVTVKVPEVVPTRSISKIETITDSDGNIVACEETSTEEDLEELVRKVDRNLPSLAEGGARRAADIFRAVRKGLSETTEDTP